MFGQKQLAMTPGQSLVIYESNVCLGGGFIKNTINL
jgi:tRNA-specific 2-thiouridylase